MAAFAKFVEAYIDSFPDEIAKDLLTEDSKQLVAFASQLSAPALIKLFLHWPRTLATQMFASLDLAQQEKVLELAPHLLGLQLISVTQEKNRFELLQRLSDQKAQRFRRSLEFPQKSLGYLCEPEILVARRSDSLKMIRGLIQTNPGIFNDYVYLEDQTGEVKGVISFRNVFLKPPEASADEFMNSPVKTFAATTLAESCFHDSAWKLYSAVPIKTEDGALLGVVRSSTIMKLAGRSQGEREASTSMAANALGETFWVGLSGVTAFVNKVFDEKGDSQ